MPTPASARSPALDADDPLGTRRIVQQTVREQMAREAAPIVAWLDANVDTVRGLAMPSLVERVRREVPEARALPVVQVEAAIREWTTLRGVVLPRLSLFPTAGVSEIPRAPSRSLADSDLVSALQRLSSIPTSIVIERPHGRTEIGVSGATVELIGGGARVGGSISWGGTMGVFTEIGGIRFAGTLSAERWSMTVTLPPGTPVPDASRLGEIFREGEEGLRAIARQTGGLSSLDEVSTVVDAVSPHLEPVKRAIDAARGIAEARERRVSLGITAGGPALTPAASDPGFQVSATLTIRF
jgi:hypothetical protein